MTKARPDGKGHEDRRTFSTTTSVSIKIDAPPQRVWSLLTNAEDFPRWNPEVASMEGNIAPGGALRLTVPIAPGRVFKPKVVEYDEPKRMVWAEGARVFFGGKRTFTVTPATEGGCVFTMVEGMGGLMFPMAAKSLPKFSGPFERYAAALKQEAERTG